MKRIKLLPLCLALLSAVGLGFFACSDDEEALLYANYDFIEFSGPEVISRSGLEMVASSLSFDKDTSKVTSEVTVGTNVYYVNFAFIGKGNGTYSVMNSPTYMSGIKYKSMKEDSTFAISRYKITDGSINYDVVDDKTVLLDVNLNAYRYETTPDSLIMSSYIRSKGKIRATIVSTASKPDVAPETTPTPSSGN